MPVIQI